MPSSNFKWCLKRLTYFLRIRKAWILHLWIDIVISPDDFYKLRIDSFPFICWQHSFLYTAVLIASSETDIF